MKLLFIITAANLASSRVRVLDLLPRFDHSKFSIDVESYPKSIHRKVRLFLKTGQYDCVILQKKLPNIVESWLLRKCSHRLLFDFDDVLHLDQNVNPKKTRIRTMKFRQLLKSVDAVVAGNSYLADIARSFRPNLKVFEIPSGVAIQKNTNVNAITDLNKEAAATPAKNTIFTICWIGNNNNLPYLLELQPQLQRLSQEYTFQLVVISGKAIQMDGVNLMNVSWSAETQYRELSQCHVGLMPLPDNDHTKGKCGYKALQYMAAGVVPVISNVGMNAKIVRDGVDGLLVNNRIDGFYSALRQLINQNDRLQEMAQQASTRVQQLYSLDVVADAWQSLLLSLMLTEKSGPECKGV